ncbi:hypothetical protein AAG570_005818 [Ranatra chinensis]|uniref:Uncharacterized protein n=1 Tax=Ranatra chinensis TaxID=642074 RepID=A0ABD0YDI3_9HEMI
MQAELPLDPDDQRRTLLQQVHLEQNIPVTEEDIERINYYLEKGFEPDMLEPFPDKLLDKARDSIPLKSRKKFVAVLRTLEQEVKSYYEFGLRVAILDYIMLDKSERRRLNITHYPQRFPALTLRSPVYWHQMFITCSEKQSRNLFIGHPVLRALRTLWFDKYKDMIIVPFSALQTVGLPMKHEAFRSLVEKLCRIAKSTIEEE